MNSQRRKLTRGVAAGVLTGTAAVGLVLMAPLPSTAAPAASLVQQAPPTTDPAADATATDDTATTATATADPNATPPAADGGTAADSSGRSTRLLEILAPLVADGTITQDQADAVVAELDDAWPAGGSGGGPGPDGRRGGRGGGHWVSVEAVAEAIGVEAAELREQLGDGATLAEIATANGVEPQVVIDALVAEVTERLTTAVGSGRLTQEEADERLAEATERITELVNEGAPALGDDDADDDGDSAGGDETTDSAVTTEPGASSVTTDATAETTVVTDG